MAAKHLIRFALVTGLLYGGWALYQNAGAQAALAGDDFFEGGALDSFNELGDFNPFEDFEGPDITSTPAAPRRQTAGVFDFLGFGGFFSSDGVSPNFHNVAPAGVNVDIETMARTIWGEARGGGAAGMAAVANVIMNRVRDGRWPSTAGAVASQNKQFSTWNDGDPNGPKALSVTRDDPHFRQALNIAKDAYAGALRDQTGGATHFYASSIDAPGWATDGTVSARIGGHIFLTGVA